jgi:RNA polymerase sigma-70 factor (ECF subfamily)
MLVIMSQATDNDQELLHRARGGDFDAFEQLVGRYEGLVYSHVYSILRHAQDTEDVVQTTFVKALENLDTFREEAAFKTWLMRIAANTALKLLNRKARTEVSLDQATDPDAEGHIAHPDYIADWGENPEQRFARRETQRILREALAELPDNQRVVFVLRDLHGLSVAETAEALNISRANVKVRLLRARLALREGLTRVFGADRQRLSPDHNHSHDGEDRVPARDVLSSYIDFYGGVAR